MGLYCSYKFLFILSFSGGYDSSYLLVEYAKDGLLCKVLVVHYDHAVREESSKEAFDIAQFLFECNAMLEYKRLQGGISSYSYNKLRILRYSFIFEVAHKYNVKSIITGHNKNDMVENFFIRLANRSGMYGLASFKARTIWLYNGSKFIVIKALINTDRGLIESKVAPIVNDRLNSASKKLRSYFRQYLSRSPRCSSLSRNVSSFTKMLGSVLVKRYSYVYDSNYLVLYGRFYTNVIRDVVSMVRYIANACFCINSIFSHKIRQATIRELVIEYTNTGFAFGSVNMGTVILFDGLLYVFRQYRFVNIQYLDNHMFLILNCAHTIAVYYNVHDCIKPRIICFTNKFVQRFPHCINKMLMKHQVNIIIYNSLNDRMFINVSSLTGYVSMFIFGNDVFIIENRHIKTYHI